MSFAFINRTFMKKTSLFLIFLCLSCPALGENFNIAIGESIQLPTHATENLYFQKKGLVSLKDLGSKIIITGRKLGETKLTMGKKNHHIRILRKNLFQTLKQLQKWSEKKRGPKIHVTNQHISIGGQILSFHDFRDLKKFTEETSNFQITARITTQLQKKIKTYITKILRKTNLTPGTLDFQSHLQMKIDKKNQKQKNRYKKLLNPFGIELISDPDELIQTPVIKIKLYAVHLKKSFLKKWGLEWPGNFSANVLPETTKFEFFKLSLQALEAQGSGQILASPTLITESGQTAEFHSGGEFPLVTTNQFNNRVQWKPYGLFLKTTPKVNARKNLKVTIKLELSNIDQSLAINGIPSMTRSHFKTEVNLKTPRPIVLSGFYRHESGKNSQGLPWLKRIPFLSSLFANGQIHNSEMELAFILLPSFYEQ